jgi:hypothetical protein
MQQIPISIVLVLLSLFVCALCGTFPTDRVVAVQQATDKASKDKSKSPGLPDGIKGPNHPAPAWGHHEGGHAIGSAYTRALDRYVNPNKVGSPGGPSHDWRDHATLGVLGLDGKDLGDRSRDRRDYPSLGTARDFTVLPAGIPNTFHGSGASTVAVAICTNLKFGFTGLNYCVTTEGKITAEVSWTIFSAAVGVDSSGKVSGQGCLGVSADVGMGLVYSNSTRICVNSTREITIEKSEGIGYGAALGPSVEGSKTVHRQTTTPTGLSIGFPSN